MPRQWSERLERTYPEPTQPDAGREYGQGEKLGAKNTCARQRRRVSLEGRSGPSTWHHRLLRGTFIPE
jgi:hypothetical protein